MLSVLGWVPRGAFGQVSVSSLLCVREPICPASLRFEFTNETVVKLRKN